MSRTIPQAGPAESERTLGVERDHVRSHLKSVARSLREEGIPVPSLDGKLLRPLTAYLVVPTEFRHRLDQRFWMGALAVEMVHEASLLHDDILDDAAERRGKPTMVAAAGVGPALVKGDHLLTSAYRAAAGAGCPAFLDLFIHSVERTVAGEIAQEKGQGRVLSQEEYHAVITGKSGQLFRAVFSLAPELLEAGSPQAVGQAGARLGRLYQMVDDFLDYCPSADRGKTPLQDYHQKKWTWPLGLLGVTHFDAPDREVVRDLFTPARPGDIAPMEKGVQYLEKEVEQVIMGLGEEGMETTQLRQLLTEWVHQARTVAAREVQSGASKTAPDNEPDHGTLQAHHQTDHADLRAQLALAASGLATPENWLAYFGHHSKTFRFASRFFPAEPLRKTAGVYSFCRFTDDLVDEAGPAQSSELHTTLDVWVSMAREAFKGQDTGVGLLDQVMGDMRNGEVPFRYVEELVEGVRMDLRPRGYSDLSELRTYSFRVASVVGGWLTRLFGVHDSWVLDRAYSLGHAMQLTNILRDVGEDLERDRLYLPADLLRDHGIDLPLLQTMARPGASILPGYRDLLDRLMAEAEREYERAFQAIPFLPGFFQRPVAVAARVYEGIHTEIRGNGYDNLRRRAHTSLRRKMLLGGRALWELRGLRSRHRGGTRLPAPVHGQSLETASTSIQNLCSSEGPSS